MQQKRHCRVIGLALPAVIITVWQGLSWSGILNPSMIPSPASVFIAAVAGIRTGDLTGYVAISIARVMRGFVIASAAGVLAGLTVGWLPGARALVNPLLSFLRQIPPIAWIPVLIMWFGIGEGSKVSVIAYAAFFPVFLNTETAAARIGASYLELGRVFRFRTTEIIWRIVIPGSLGPIFAGLRLGLSSSWRALVAAEMLASSSGLGYMIVISRELVRPDAMFLGILVIGLLGYLTDIGALRLQRTIAPWS